MRNCTQTREFTFDVNPKSLTSKLHTVPTYEEFFKFEFLFENFDPEQLEIHSALTASSSSRDDRDMVKPSVHFVIEKGAIKVSTTNRIGGE